MKETLVPGVTRTERVTVDRDRTIEFMGDELRVYATPSMVRDVEYTSLRLIEEHLDEGESSVGVHVAMDHVAATPLGEEVEIEVRVGAVNGRQVRLEAEVRDPLEVVGRGAHVRVVIDVARQAARLEKKRAALAAARTGGGGQS